MIKEEIEELLDSANAESNTGNYAEAERIVNDLLANEEMLAEFQISSLIQLANSLNKQGKYEHSLSQAQKALELAEAHGFRSDKAKAATMVAIVYQNQGFFEKSLEHYEKALSIYKELDEKSGISAVTGNMGNIYRALGSYEIALEYIKSALIIHKELGEKYSVANVTSNIGNVYNDLGSHQMALEYYEEALIMHQELGRKSGVAIVTGNIGNVYQTLGYYQKALEYNEASLKIHLELSEKPHVARVKGNMGYLYSIKEFKAYNITKAEEYLLQAKEINREIGTKAGNLGVFKTLFQLYEQTGRLHEAIDYLKKYHELEKEVQSEEAKKKANQLDHQRKIELQDKELAIKKAASEAKHDATQSLLHKVMPDIIAKRMIEGEAEIADYFPSVSILFADIEGFTPMSADMPAYIVVRFLNHIFREFDRVMKKHGCEKIKTIGDGYMAVAGAPVACEDHAERIANAALEMRNAIEIPEDIKVFMPEGAALNIRIGIHTGSVVAGVVGEDRFVYDIYSDAVNTAARMESHGESGKIHVSSDFMRHLLNRFAQTKVVDHGIMFVKREEMEVKGKGRMKTFFLERKL